MTKDVLVRFPDGLVKRLDELVTLGLYPNRNECVRIAVRDLVQADEKLVAQIVESRKKGLTSSPYKPLGGSS